MTEFETEFRTWLEMGLTQDVPETVMAFSFNLFEPPIADAKFGIELIGASTFDPKDSDWACEEVWSPHPRSIEIPLKWSGATWQECLNRSCHLVKRVCENGGPAFSRLTDAEAVALGFVDGELEVVWAKP